MWPRRRGARLLRLLLPLVLVLLTGCWDRTEVEDQAYVTALGLDQGDGGQLLVTARVALPQMLTIGALGARTPHSGAESSTLLTARAATMTQAIHTMNAGMTRQLNLHHLRGVVVGESLARAGLEPYTMELLRNPLVRNSIMLGFVRGRAHDAMQALSPVGESNPGRLTEGFILQAKRGHLAPPMRLHHFSSRLAAAGGDPFAPAFAINPGAGALPRGGGNPVEMSGAAIFRRDRLMGFITVDESQMMLALRGELGKAYVTIPDPDQAKRAVTIRFHQENAPRYSATFQGSKPVVHVDLLLEGEVLAMPGGRNYANPQARKQLEEAAAQYARRTTEELLGKFQDWGADPVGFGHLFRNQFASWSAWQAYNWREHVRDLAVHVDVRMRIRRYGLTIGGDRVNGGR